MTDPQDKAELRLRAADPAGSSRALPPPRVDRAELLEGIMSTTISEPVAPAPKSNRPRWLLAAAAVIAIAAAGTAVALNVGGDSGNSPAAVKTVKTLKLPAAGGGSTAMCIQFSVDILRDMPVAFDGTVSEVTDGDALLTVNHWYKGGSADEVRLESNNNAGVALEGGVSFEAGKRYLVTASDGAVSLCGFTGEWSPELEQSFQEAFGS